jgi:hypothetical protein
MKQILPLLILFLFSNAQAFESVPDWFFVPSTYSGHEEITRQALNNTAKRLMQPEGTSNIFTLETLQFNVKPEARGILGHKSKNMVIHGNFATDFPKQTKVLSLKEFWKIKDINDFESRDNQVLHFLRNYKDSVTLMSAHETCVRARENIKYVTAEALKAWQNQEPNKALFLIGHAVHAIQDSFSPAHAQRDDEAHNYNLKNVCFYGMKMAEKLGIHSRQGRKLDLCYHSSPDSKDAIWNLKRSQYKQALSNWGHSEKVTECDKNEKYPESEEAKQSCLKSEARLAKLATEKYLFIVFSQISPANFVQPDASDIVASLDNRLFDGPVGVPELDQKMANGIMRCEGLSTEEFVGTEIIEN